jgi:hypothetical protein
MSARHELPLNASLRVTTSSGNVTIIAEERADVQTPDDARVETIGADARGEDRTERRRRERPRRHRRPALQLLKRLVGAHAPHPRQQGPALEVHSPRAGSRKLEVRCPAGTPISVGTLSGDVRLQGDFGAATITTTSGDVSVDRAAALDARSVSGDLEVDRCSGLCRLNTKSGHIEAGHTGPTEAATVSGRVRLRNTAGGVTVRTISGKVELATDGTEAVKARTVSGDIAIRVPTERLPEARLRSLSGKVCCDCLQGSDFPLEVTSVSGKIEVEPA